MNIAILTQAIATLAWFGVVGLIGLIVVRASRKKAVRGLTGIFFGVLVVAMLFSTISMGLVYIRPEERGVVLSAFAPLGYREEVLQPGLRWVIPFAESVVIYPISKQTYTMSIAGSEGPLTQGDDSVAARTADGQEIYVDASVIFAIDPTKVIKVHIDWQNRYAEDLVRAQARGIIRDVISQYRVDEVVSSQRFDMVSEITVRLEKKLSDNGLILVDFVLRNITFSPEYAQSVEQKQIAEQQALQAAFVVERKKQEAEQARQEAQGLADAAVISARGAAEARLIQAEAEARALQLIAEAIRNNPDLLTYQYITKLAPNVQVMYLPTGQPYLIPLPQP